MRTDVKRWGWLFGCAMILALTAGCFQQAGIGLEPLAQAVAPSFTPLPPTDTPLPPTEEATATLELVEVTSLPTSTPEDLPFQPTEDVLGSGITQVAQLPTTDPLLEVQPPPPQQQEIDPVFLTATAIIQAATAT